MKNPARLRHIAISVPDPEKAAKFYIAAFGLKRVGEADWENAKGVYLSDGVINLGLLHYKTEAAAGHRASDFVGAQHVGVGVDAAAASRNAIEDAGGTHWMGESKDAGYYEIKFHDPDGVVADLTQSGWAAEKR